MPCAESWVRRRNCSPPGTKTSAWRGRSAPPDSTRSRSGRRFSSATSMARKSLRIVVGLVVPPRTVGSFAMTRHCVCATSASATTTPPPRRVAGVQAGQRAQLEHGGARVDERLEPLAHHHLAAGAVALDVLRAAAGQHLVVQRAHLVGQRAHGVGVGAELARRRGEVRPQDGAHGVVSHDGARFCRKASMPSAASGPANSAAEVAAADASPSAHPARQVRSSSLVAPTAPGRGLAHGARLRGDPRVERSLVVDDRGEQPGRRRLVRVEALAGEDHAGEEAPVHHAQRRDQDHGRSHADPHLGEGERRGRRRDGQVGRRDQAEPPARACPLTRAMTGTGLSTMRSGCRACGSAPPRPARRGRRPSRTPSPSP